MDAASRTLPTPNVTRITTLSQAHATLHHCCTVLWWQSHLPATVHFPNEARRLGAEEKKNLRIWLENWEAAFTEFLSAQMSTMGADDLTQCRVLKANHLTCCILASDGGPEPSDFDVFEAEFQAIVELAQAVLQARTAAPSPPSGTTTTPLDLLPVSSGLGIQAPLYVVVTRCTKRDIWDRANRLSLQARGL
ncbi:hypothetical protein BAUCODRAFT_417842 [Baudoinia panamericana UAMH 10762]|uniref:Uncharacterized protein n=1 Tax=Baudoinia panamericana (strain UAMH 10762) TaxID=717646 RepID=M2N2S3_BAUPA|nr:uncharacterized protein BAUCODRAFT_417842 [Baudoinia panamericana UAMH 10762]EMC98248.1 hypothetical protein BAUCODRAFT_417842 [Baudoinia panamericana UAMH 10762]